MLRGVLLLLCLGTGAQPGTGAAALVGCSRLTVTFQRSGWFGLRSDEVLALDQLTCSFGEGITALIGPSGCGKSTLGKLIAKREPALHGGQLLAADPSFPFYRSHYIDPLYYLEYDGSQTCKDLLGKATDTSDSNNNTLVLERGLATSGVPPTSKVDSLLESERRMFEIILCLARSRGRGPPIVVLDEYLDKDSIVVKKKIATFLRAMCADPEVNLQVFLITHSESAMLLCSDYVVALNGGRLFNQGRPTTSFRKPSQLIMLH